MQTRISPRLPRWRLALRCLLAVHLACSVGGGSLFGLAHLALSDHRHAFCAEHGSFEDLPKTSSADRKLTPAPVVTDQDPSTIEVLASTFPSHTTCLFLNTRTFQAPLQIADHEPEVAPGNPALDRASPRHDGVVADLLLLSAPKTSPPFVAA